MTIKRNRRQCNTNRLAIEGLEDRRLLAGTPELLKDIAFGDSNPSNFVEMGSLAFFTANDGTNGTELWKSDGTTAGTVLIKDIRPADQAGLQPPSQLTNVNGTVYFVANDGTHGYELWKSDGSTAGTVLVKDIRPGSNGSAQWADSNIGFTNVSGTLYFTANDGPHGYELWKSDGTEAGTVMVKDISGLLDERGWNPVFQCQ